MFLSGMLSRFFAFACGDDEAPDGSDDGKSLSEVETETVAHFGELALENYTASLSGAESLAQALNALCEGNGEMEKQQN